MNNLIPVTYNDARILTTEQLAQIYECTEKNISDNFNNNKKRFEKGKHYYLLQGEELKWFKNSYENFGVVGKNANQLYLWTERGADRHCKMIGTDNAWEQFDNLEETYFRVKEYTQENTQSFTPPEQPPILNTMNVVKFIADDLRVSTSSRVKMYRQVCENEGINSNFLPDYTDEKAGRSATELLKKFNIPMSTVKFNKLMLEHEFLQEETRTSTNRQGFKKYKSLTEKGLKYGKNKASTHGSEKETQPLYYEDSFIELVNILAPLKEVI